MLEEEQYLLPFHVERGHPLFRDEHWKTEKDVVEIGGSRNVLHVQSELQHPLHRWSAQNPPFHFLELMKLSRPGHTFGCT